MVDTAPTADFRPEGAQILEDAARALEVRRAGRRELHLTCRAMKEANV